MLHELLCHLAITHAGAYRLETIYERNVGERAPANSGRLVEFLNHHYGEYPEDIQKDLPELGAQN